MCVSSVTPFFFSFLFPILVLLYTRVLYISWDCPKLDIAEDNFDLLIFFPLPPEC